MENAGGPGGGIFRRPPLPAQRGRRIREGLDVDTALRAVMDGARSLAGAPCG